MPVEASSSDSTLIDACLSRVRREARLDDEPVLPPLDVLVRAAMPPSRLLRGVVELPLVVTSEAALPSPEARGASSSERPRGPGAVGDGAPDDEAIEHARAPTHRPREMPGRPLLPTTSLRVTLVRGMRWPVLLCGFFAGTFGGVALIKSPVGQRPAMRGVVKVVQHSAATAWSAASDLSSRLTR